MLLLDSDEPAGLLVVDGRIRSGAGVMAEGIFIQQVIPESPADLDGRSVCPELPFHLQVKTIKDSF